MDEERRIRFLYPPMILLASIAFGVYVSPSNAARLVPWITQGGDWGKSLVVVLAGGSVFLLSVGYLIGATTVLLLRFIGLLIWLVVRIFCCRRPKRSCNYEAPISELSLSKAWMKIGADGTPDPKKSVYAEATFTYDKTSNAVRGWMVRRWNNFFTAANAAISVALALAIGKWLLSLRIEPLWILTSIAVFLILAILSFLSWRESIKMAEFQIALKSP